MIIKSSNPSYNRLFYIHSKNNPFKCSPGFTGALEDGFFSAVKDGDQKSASNSLSKINFDIVEQDAENGNNVFHYIMQDNSEALWKKLFSLLGNVVARVSPEKIDTALNAKNNQNKMPYDLAVDDVFLRKVQGDMSRITTGGQTAVVIAAAQKPVSISTPPPVTAQAEKPVQELVGNEVSSFAEIDADLNFDDFLPAAKVNRPTGITPKGTEGLFGDVIGLNHAKSVLKEFIVDPIKSNKPVLVNGILLYGQGNNGKSHIVESLCRHLDKEIIPTKKALGLLDGKNVKEIEKVLDKYAISISVDDYRDVDNVLDYIKSNYKKTGKQTIMFIDEIAKIFQSDQNLSGRYSYRDVPEFMRKFDNFALNGGVLIGTTNDIDYIQSDILRSNRFQKRVELKFPNQDERKQIFESYLGEKLKLSDSDYQKLLKKTAGFSYGDLTAVLRIVDAENDEVNHTLLDEAVESYAKENNMGTLSDEGTTSNYDTKLLQREPMDTNFSDVAGMEDVKSIFKTTIIDRLKPEVIQRFKENKRPLISTNFLVYGPSGTGKTFVVKALSGETRIPMYKIDGSTFMSKYVGESEQNLKKIFRQLETKFKETDEYSILFIDEANKILGKRDGLNSKDSEYVEQLLQYIDNSYERGIITITATNYKDKMDEAVLSRLGQQMMIGFPELETIKSLIKIQLRNIKSASGITEEEINEIASRVRGFGSREITQMITRTIDENLQSGNKQLTVDDFKNEISAYAESHELPAINERNRTSAYDKFIKRLDILPTDPQSLDDIGGMQDVKEKLLNAVMASSLKPETLERYKKNRVKGQNGILLYGKPGCGKTYIMKALAAHTNLPIYEFKMSQFGSKWSHETTENIGRIFEQLKEKYKRTSERSILMIDEFEDIASRRENEPNAFRVEETNTLLKEISDAERNGIIIVVATNHFDRIDDAMKRPGRFICVEVTPPDLEARKDIIQKALRGREIAERIFEYDNNFDILAQATEDFATVDITETINRLVKEAIDNDVEKLSLKNLQDAFVQRTEDKVKEDKLNHRRMLTGVIHS